jgi:hypothetical protein
MNHAFLLGTCVGELGKTRLWKVEYGTSSRFGKNKFLPFCPAEYNRRRLRVRRNRGILHPNSWSASAIATVWQPKFTDTLPPFFSAPQEQVKKSSGILHRNKCPATLALCSYVHDGWKEKKRSKFGVCSQWVTPPTTGCWCSPPVEQVSRRSRCRCRSQRSGWIERRECVDGLLTRS